MSNIDPKAHEDMLRALGWKPPEPVKWPKGMFLSHDEARTVACGLLPDGVDVDKLTPKAKQEICAAIDTILNASHNPDPEYNGGDTPPI